MGTTTSALNAGFYPTSTSPSVQTWNGTNWTNSPSMNTQRLRAGFAGTKPSALIYGGGPDGAPGTFAGTESWNDSAWTEVADLNTGRNSMASSGASNESALAAGGTPPGALANTEEWSFSGGTITFTDS